MTDRELLQQALDAIKHLCLHSAAIKGYDGEQVQTAIDVLKARLAPFEPEPEKSQDKPCVEDDGCPTEKAVLQRFWREHQAQPEQEPVGINKVIIDSIRDSSEIVAPPKREWVGLTDEEINAAWDSNLSFARAIEAKLKEKNA